MGTLTADSARLPEFCDHKLPTSCRLFIPNCCACADERAHAASYSTYIDGVGFVPRGTRWQRYCWFCKEFWEQRVRVSGLRPGQTRIPEQPDQAEFLEKWYEFHRGYRLVIKEDGSQERVAVLGEDFRNVSPGYLPRTVEELRTGHRQEQEVQQADHSDEATVEESGPSLDDMLEQMFEEAAAEEESDLQPPVPTSSVVENTEPPGLVLNSSIHAQSMNPTGLRSREYQLRRVAALRRELNRMRSGIERVISGLRDLGEDVPDYQETTDHLLALTSALESIDAPPTSEQASEAIRDLNSPTVSAGTQSSERTLSNMQTRVDEARAETEEARQARDQASVVFETADERYRERQARLQQLQREQRTTENYMRIFGTREEMIAMGDSYESPIGGMFTRAEARFRAAEEARVEERTLREVLAAEVAEGNEEETRRLLSLDEAPRDVWGVPVRADVQTGARRRSTSHEDRETGRSGQHRHVIESGPTTPREIAATGDEAMLQQYYALIRAQERENSDPDSTHVMGEQDTIEEWAAEGASVVNFPQSMLSAIGSTVDVNDMPPIAQDVSSEMILTAAVDELPANQVSPSYNEAQWQSQDAEHIIRRLTTDDSLRRDLDMSAQETSVLLAFFMSDTLSEVDRATIDRLLTDPTAIWKTNLPTEWLRRRKQLKPDAIEGTELLLTEAEALLSSIPYNSYMQLEMIAQAYQMSAEVRRLATQLSPIERLQTLYRLQAGERSEGDRAVLQHIFDDSTSQNVSMRIYRDTLTSNRLNNETGDEIRQLMDSVRHRRARLVGGHSRSDLDSRRRETAQEFALAAGRQAMQTSPRILMERAATEALRAAARNDATQTYDATGAGTRAAYRRLQNNFPGRPPRIYRQLTLSDYLNETSSQSDSENEEDAEPRGLDALDTDRPEPKADEDLKVQMECKICYTQLAEVACLPCGHLVMCRWCSEQHSPCHPQDRTRPRRPANCPVCRKGIKQKARIYRA